MSVQRRASFASVWMEHTAQFPQRILHSTRLAGCVSQRLAHASAGLRPVESKVGSSHPSTWIMSRHGDVRQRTTSGSRKTLKSKNPAGLDEATLAHANAPQEPLCHLVLWQNSASLVLYICISYIVTVKTASFLGAWMMLSSHKYRVLSGFLLFVCLIVAWYTFSSNSITNLLPNGVLKTHSQPSSPIPPVPTPSGWVFDPKLHARNYGLTDQQCSAAFSGLWHEIDRAAAYRDETGKVTSQDVDISWRGDAIVRAMIYDHQVRSPSHITASSLTQLPHAVIHPRSARRPRPPLPQPIPCHPALDASRYRRTSRPAPEH